MPDREFDLADDLELVDITPEALRRRLSHGNVYAPERIDAALSNYFRPGNLTALRELALLWLADQVDAALAKYRADHHISDTWEARERVVVAVTGRRRVGDVGAQSVSHRVEVQRRTDGGARGARRRPGRSVGPGRWGEYATSSPAWAPPCTPSSATDVPAALLDFAREMNATQLVLGTSRRSRWARIFDEGIGAKTVQHSGKIDVHMVTHEQAKPGWSWSSASPRRRHLTSWLAAVVVPIVDLRGHRRHCSTASSGSAARARCSSSVF